jgi:hypothetical protein
MQRRLGRAMLQYSSTQVRFICLYCCIRALYELLTVNKVVRNAMHRLYCHVYECDSRRGVDWRLDLLTTLTHDS